jgi:hypothetical protein
MEDLLKQILNKLHTIEDHMKNLATRQEVEEAVIETKESLIEEMKRVAHTLETIAVGEAAVTAEKLEDKVEAGDMILKSLIDGLEVRLKEEIKEVKSDVKEILQGIRAIVENQQATSKILFAYSDKFEKQDDMLELINRELLDQLKSWRFVRS